MHTIDITKHELSRAIDNHQKDIDIDNTHRLKSDRSNLISTI